MESDEIQQALRDADRAAAAPWTDYRPPPWWFAPAAGLWSGLVVLLVDQPLAWVTSAIWLLALVWLLRRQGVVARGASPREFRRPAVIWIGLLIAAAGIAIVLWQLVDPWVAAAVTAVLVAITFAWYERAYARAAERTRKRLA